LVLPESMADVDGDCTCPDDSGACQHGLALIYELCAAADPDPAVLLEFAGVPLASLLARLTADPVRSAGAPPVRAAGADRPSPGPIRAPVVPDAVFYGESVVLPPLPEPPPVDPMVDLDSALLRTALRRSGTAAADTGEAVDELAELYARLRAAQLVRGPD
jgi:hypothetical protein